MSVGTPTHGPRHGWVTTAALSVGAAFAYGLLQRRQAHGSDIFTLARWLDEPGFVHPHHPLYLPVAKLLLALLAPLGLDRMTGFGLYSALGAAVGIAALHRATLALRSDPGMAIWLSLLAGAVPAVHYFATIGELHAPFFGMAALGWWAACAWARRPGLGAAVRCGAIAGLAALFHATGAVLGPWFAGAFGWRQRHRGLRQNATEMLACGAASAAVWACGFFGLRAHGHAPTGQPIEHIAERFDLWVTVAAWPRTALVDWLLPFAPCSLLALTAFGRGRAAPAALLHLAVAAHVTFTACLLRGGGHEFGAYDLPLVFPAAVLALDAVPRRGWPLLFPLAIAATVLHRAAYPRLTPDLALGRAAVAAAAESPTVFLVGDEAQTQGIRWFDPHAELIEAWVFQVQLGSAASAFTPEQVAGWLAFQQQQARAGGRRLFVTDLARRNLTEWLPGFAAGWQRFAATAQLKPAPPQSGLSGVFVQPR